MVTKALKRKELELGFIQIPLKERANLLGQKEVPYETRLNGVLAKVDKYGRIWSDVIRQKFQVDTFVNVSKSSDGFILTPIEKGQSKIILDNKPENQTLIPIDNCFLDISKIATKPFFRTNSTSVFNEDILKTDVIEKNTIDLIVTSPPYCIAVNYENYDDGIPYEDYLTFSKDWLKRCYDFVKKDGRLCLNIPLDKNKGGQQSVYSDLTKIAKEIGWKYQSTIIWNEQNISRRTAWGSWLSASAPFVIAPVEVIVVLYKETWGKLRKGKSDINKKDFIDWTNGVWSFNGESKRRIGHPAPFPTELPKRCIRLFSYVGDLILDPFLGSGTTLLACLETNRLGIGVEINKNYCALSERRLTGYLSQRKL
jgi:site-specific DNA-methyltransferase (adenine-specific)